MSHTADPFTGEPSGAEMAQAWVQNHQSPETETLPLSGTVVQEESPAEQTHPFTPVFDDRPPSVAVTVVQHVTVPPHPFTHADHCCTCHFCQPPSTPPRHPYAIWESAGGIGIQPCADCAVVYADEPAQSEDHLLAETIRAAQLAGWRGDALRTWRCPDCHAKHQADLDAVPRWAAEGPGSEMYEERLALHLAFLAESDKKIHAAGFYAPGGTVADEMRLRSADVMDGFAMSEGEASAIAVTAMTERRAA